MSSQKPHAMNPWDLDYRLDIEAVAALAASEGLVGNVRELGAGWDYTTFTCDGIVIRVPKRADTAEALADEHAILLRLPSLTLPVPRPRPSLVRTAGIPYPSMLYPLLAGTPLCDSGDSEAGTPRACPPARLGEIVGGFLLGLHAASTASRIGEDLADAEPFTFDEWNDWNLAALDRVASALPAAELRNARSLLQRTLPPVTAPMVFAHCDLNDEHILVDAAGEPCAVIDWGDADIAPWWFDFTGLWLWGGDAALDAALAAAGRSLAGTDRLHLAHHALCVSIGELEYGLSSSGSPRDADLSRERFARALAFAAA
jgi:aminoglycoside phosphotransferase (APT) family kinase protein